LEWTFSRIADGSAHLDDTCEIKRASLAEAVLMDAPLPDLSTS
jgi:hypothetical protein